MTSSTTKGYAVERWSGKAWYASLCSPYKTMADVQKHLKDYWWHYTTENPYRIVDYKSKTKVQKYSPKYKNNWNSDDNMVVCISGYEY